MGKHPITGWTDLKQFGINALTNEACAFQMRMLCDLSEIGRRHLAEFLGIAETGFCANWNSRVGDEPAVASVMLTHGMIGDLAKFLFFQDGALATADMNGQWVGVYTEDRLAAYEAYFEDTGSGRLHRNRKGSVPNQPVRGSRNVHAFSERVQ